MSNIETLLVGLKQLQYKEKNSEDEPTSSVGKAFDHGRKIVYDKVSALVQEFEGDGPEPPDITPPQCGNCGYNGCLPSHLSESSQHEGYVMCHRYPPPPGKLALVKRDNWCGEWRSKEIKP